MHEDRDTLIEQSQQYFWLYVTALLEYIDLFAWFLLAVFDAIFLHEFSCDTARKCDFKAIIPEDYSIIPELFVILFTTHYSKNYSGIMYACLTACLTACFNKHQWCIKPNIHNRPFRVI